MTMSKNRRYAIFIIHCHLCESKKNVTNLNLEEKKNLLPSKC